ncbi:hypothetical protein [Nocardioides sp.]|uniref:hypothetical protein n=1 Tax=Nocardioides sp. TaxID=35761 RepID=UPI001A1C3C85|nr:hypothetical protein [Nocardioides sp.]MBJ7359098.1 hypothetical protein [Nocardioides sp.]
MTDQMLRDLLEERVSGVAVPDLSAGAWRTGRRARRRTRLAVLGAAAAATAAVTLGGAVLTGTGRTTQPAPPPGGPTLTSAPTPPTAEPDARYEGVPVWWSVGREQEGDLSPVDDSPLPEVIDLRSAPTAERPDRAVAAFAVGDQVRLVDPSGAQLSLSLDRLDDVTKPNGYRYRPVSHSMLSPTGEYLVFPQDDSVEVYTLATGQWRSIDTGDRVTRFVTWVGDDSFVLPGSASGGGDVLDVRGDLVSPGGTQMRSPRLRPGFDTRTAQAFGLTRRSPGGSEAQAWGMGVPVPVADPGKHLAEPEFVAARVGGVTRVLAILWEIHDEGRYLQCCPVAGWLDDRTLVYESRQTDPALVAWTVGSDEFRLVSRIEGSYAVASFAQLWQD